jgi:hypothetical protein
MRLVGVAVMLAGWLSIASAASAQNSIWAVCWTGNQPQSCDDPPPTGWWTTGVSVVWHATGEGTPSAPTSTSPCSLGIQYAYGDVDTNVSCQAQWSATSKDTHEITLRVEASNPVAGTPVARPPDSNGWYNHPVTVNFVGGSSWSGFSGNSCNAPSYGGPDTSGTALVGTCIDNAGKSANATFSLKYDATPPVVTGVRASRRPDHNGWYNHPVTFRFNGTDGMSGLDGCTNTRYAGPDGANAEVNGACRDKAGNIATLGVGLRYDSTPPCLDATTSPGDGMVLLHWAGCARMKIVRSPGIGRRKSSLVGHGSAGTLRDGRVRDGIRYTYTISGEDQAGNVTVKRIGVVPGPRLLAPAPNARLTTPPVLRWTAKRGASYYNVQLYRGGTKILSAWPVRPTFKLSGEWKFAGRHYRLTPAVYRWYVWPGFGRRAADRYGSRIGSGSFIIVSASV